MVDEIIYATEHPEWRLLTYKSDAFICIHRCHPNVCLTVRSTWHRHTSTASIRSPNIHSTRIEHGDNRITSLIVSWSMVASSCDCLLNLVMHAVYSVSILGSKPRGDKLVEGNFGLVHSLQDGSHPISVCLHTREMTS